MAPEIEESRLPIISLLNEAYACRTNNLKRSIEYAQKALSMSRHLTDTGLMAQSLSRLSLFSMIMGEYDNALRLAQAAIKHFAELNDERGIADAKYNIAGVHYKTNNFHLGLANLVDCITIYRKFNDHHNLSRAHKSLGTIYEYFGDEKNAVSAYEEAIRAGRKAGDLNLESNAYNNLSGIYIKRNNIEKAAVLIERAIDIKRKTGDIRGLAFSLYGRGKVNMARKNYQQAEVDFKAAMDIHLDMGETLGQGMAFHKLAHLYLQTGHLQKAKEVLTKGLDFSTTHNIVMVKYKCCFLFYQLFKLECDPVNALHYLELYHKEKDSVINTQTLKIIENYELITQMANNEKEVQLEKAEIIKKKDIAEQTARVKQDFLSTMSHEIRTPLNAVITIASLLGDKVKNEQKELVDTLKFSSNNLLLIINDFLDFTKLDAGKAQLELRQADLKKLLGNIKNTYMGLAVEKGNQLLLNIDQEVCDHYELDETKASQIIGNLVTNAIKFTERGLITISVKKLSTDGCFDHLLFEVSDNGTGIESQHLENIFDSFFQPQTITTRKQGGTGLGLAIVKKLVELHGGTIHVSSQTGKGSVFYFDLKLTRATAPIKAIEKRLDLLAGKTVLLAEDNMINAMLIRKLLSNWKMNSEHAKNGVEAVEKSKLKVYDFVLMDIHMPEMDGYEASWNIQQKGNVNSNTPIFALTADVTAETKEEHVSLFNSFLHKPIEIDKMQEAFIKYTGGQERRAASSFPK
ncbi:Autoinducer 2 sensor kinase/phosphatase LuxQ [Mucilaginibacter gotjawali]|nr:Autoinducer 2 sensor kinase/phosphatase LuxQ [Mucilaginibacter gotjawali]